MEQPLSCPQCQATMSAMPWHGVQLDFCGTCGGIWFDRGELAQVVTPGDHSTEGQDIFQSRHSVMSCPRCDLGMVETPLTQMGIHVDKCRSCEGLFLERGELKRGQAQVRRMKRRRTHGDEAKSIADKSPELWVDGHNEWAFIFQLLTELPLEIDGSQKIFSPAVTGLIVINILVMLVAMGNLDTIIDQWGMKPAHVLAGTGWMTLLSSMFLHVGWLHLLGNLYFLFVAGDDVEEKFGTLFFLLFFLLCGLGAKALFIVTFPDSVITVVGSSGAISGVLGAYMAMFPGKRFMIRLFYVIPLTFPAWVYLGFWVVIQLVFAAMDVPGVAWYSHVGGFVCGLLGAVAHHLIISRR